MPTVGPHASTVDAVRTLGQPNASFAGDTGAPDPRVRALLAEAYTDGLAYQRAIVELCSARFLLPIVASGDESGEGPDPGRHAEMAVVLVTSASGATAVPVFTGLDALQAWHPEARPVPCTLDDVAATAAETGSTAIVVDLAGPASVVVEGDVLAHLGEGHRLVELVDGGFGWVVLSD